MADFIAEPIDSPQAGLFEDCSEAGSPRPQTIAALVSVLIKQILDLRETLEFYEVHLYEAANTEAPSGPCEISDGCMESDTPEPASTFA